MDFIKNIAALDNIKKIALTTNGTLTAPYVKDFKSLKISSVNLSLDSLDPKRFFEVTRRDEFHNVMKTLDELLKLSETRYVPPYHLALAYNGLGETDKTFEWLEKAYAERDPKMAFLKVDPKWNNLRSDPRFIDLMRRMNFN